VPQHVNHKESHAFRIRRKATDHRLPVLTCIDTAKVFLSAVEIEQLDNKDGCLTVSPL